MSALRRYIVGDSFQAHKHNWQAHGGVRLSTASIRTPGASPDYHPSAYHPRCSANCDREARNILLMLALASASSDLPRVCV